MDQPDDITRRVGALKKFAASGGELPEAAGIAVSLARCVTAGSCVL